MRNRIPLTGAVASLLQRIALDEERFEVPALPPVVGGSWGDVALDGLWGPLRAEGASLIWEPSAKDGSAADVAQKLERIDGFRNVPASLELVRALCANVT